MPCFPFYGPFIFRLCRAALRRMHLGACSRWCRPWDFSVGTFAHSKKNGQLLSPHWVRPRFGGICVSNVRYLTLDREQGTGIRKARFVNALPMVVPSITGN